MKMFVFSDDLETLNGLKLVGVEGLLITEDFELSEEKKREICQKVDQLILSGEYGIIMLTPKVKSKINDFIEEKKKSPKPLFLTVPDRKSVIDGEDSANDLSDYIKKTIGINM